MSAFQFTDATNTAVFRRILPDGMECYSVLAQEYLDWIKAGGVTLQAVTPLAQPNIIAFVQTTKTLIGVTQLATNPTHLESSKFDVSRVGDTAFNLFKAIAMYSVEYPTKWY